MKNARYIISVFLSACISFSYAQNPSVFREYYKEYKTYPFSDPDPIPNFSKIYPYYRFDGFTNTAVNKKWKVVELENDYLRLTILPEIGGKIWSAIDKQTGRSFIYNNSVVKFRDIALRGPWTSGGIEANYGVIGHTPNCATPVNYIVQHNNDGSASFIMSVLDRLSKTRWTLEVNLPKDKAYFITRSFWQNGSPVQQPYYSWMNAGIKANDHLKFYYPGTTWIEHNGDAHTWPFDSGRKKDLSNYVENDFISSKSYHVTSTYSKYFGAYWRDEDYGIVHFSERGDKVGKKLFSWALSDQGKIWEELLTDNDGQYVEIQSGRLFNQNQEESSFTPFKQRRFAPFQTDSWEEYWYPFKNTGGLSDASLAGVVNCRQTSDSLFIAFSPVSFINDSIKIYDDSGVLLYKDQITLKPLEIFHKALPLKSGRKAANILLADQQLDIVTNSSKTLDRPVEHLRDFNWNSAYGLYMQGRDLARFTHYSEAEIKLREALLKDAGLLPALTEMSMLQYRKMKYDSSYYYAKKALSIDAYDAAANYYYALAAIHLGKRFDALDGFEVAALDPAYNSASNTELSKLYFQEKDFQKALEYAQKSLFNNARNIEGLQLQYLATRFLNSNTASIKNKIQLLDPLNPFVGFEEYVSMPGNSAKQKFTQRFTGEMPWEDYLHLAVWYYNVGLIDESKEVLSLSPTNSEVLFWKAFLNQNKTELLDSAIKSSAYLVFPYMSETAVVMQWAMKQTTDWKPAYYLALINIYRNNLTDAATLLNTITTQVNFAPFYIVKALYGNTGNKLENLKAATLADPNEWRYGNLLAEYFIAHKNYKSALEVAGSYHKLHPENYITGMVYIRCLMLNDMYSLAEKELSVIKILPYEGATYGRNLYMETKLMLAWNALQNKSYKKALNKIAESEIWPRSLGVGKPYDEVIDNGMELWMKSIVYSKMNDKKEADKYLSLLTKKQFDSLSFSNLLKAKALQQQGLVTEGDQQFNSWLNLQNDTQVIAMSKEFYNSGNNFDFLLKQISQKTDKRLF